MNQIVVERSGERVAVNEPRTVLDVGAAAGFLLEGFRRQGWQGCGIEPNQKVVDFANDHWESKVDCSTLEALAMDCHFDLVSMIQVVAHFHDVRGAFERAASVTKLGGYWLIETWDCKSLSARLFGRHWHEYSPPSVLQCFSRKSLVKLAAQFGMRTVQSGCYPKSITVAQAKSLLGHMGKTSWVARSAATAARLLPDRFTVPYPSEDLFWMAFQKEVA